VVYKIRINVQLQHLFLTSRFCTFSSIISLMAPSGEPKESPKPQPIGNELFIFLFTICTICILFLLWRRANNLRTVVAHQLKTWSRGEGRIRLSEDDGPPARSFVEDDEEDEAADDEPLSSRAERLKSSSGQAPLKSPPSTQLRN